MNISHTELRAICTEHAVDIRSSQVDESTPIFVEEVIEDAEKLFLWITKGKKPKEINVAVVRDLKK